MSRQFPKLYPIVDRAILNERGIRVRCFAGELARAGVKILQLRDKVGEPQEVLSCAAEIAALFEGQDRLLIMNDRPDLAALADWSGVHVGHKDLNPCDARRALGSHSRRRWVGVSTHNEEQVREADAGCADYVAIGPVFATGSKVDAEPVVGLEGVRRARGLTTKPLVAIGGITRDNARSLIDAGADSVAVIGALLVKGERPGKVAEDFLRILR
jgi:thiamine-phosphate pyrophosphorylase